MNQTQILNDFRRRYEGTYVFVEFPDNPKEELFHVDRIEESASTVGILCLSSNDYGKIRLNFATDHTLKFKYPPVGVFQHQKQAFYFRRVPAKQYARGICSGNSDVQAVTSQIVRFSDPMTFAMIDDAFKAQKYGITGAMYLLTKKGYKSVALEDNFAVSAPLTNSENFVLFYFDVPVAYLNAAGKVTMTLEETFREQIAQITQHG